MHRRPCAGFAALRLEKSGAWPTPSCGADFDVALHASDAPYRPCLPTTRKRCASGGQASGRSTSTDIADAAIRERLLSAPAKGGHVKSLLVDGDSGTRSRMDRRCGQGTTVRHSAPSGRGHGQAVSWAKRRSNKRRQDRLSGKVFRHIGRKDESVSQAAGGQARRRTAARRDRRATGRIADG